MELESAKTRDLAEVKDFLQACGLPHENMAPTHLVLWDKSKMVGIIGLEIRQTCGLLRSLAVSKASRGQGIALYLTGKAEEHALSRSIKELYLLTSEFEDFFSKLGYEKVERDSVPDAIQDTKEFQRLHPTGATCMVKHLG